MGMDMNMYMYMYVNMYMNMYKNMNMKIEMIHKDLARALAAYGDETRERTIWDLGSGV